MENSIVGSGNLLRLVGLMAICVGAAWVLQVLGGNASTIGRTAWVVAAASIAGGGTGLIAASGALQRVSNRA